MQDVGRPDRRVERANDEQEQGPLQQAATIRGKQLRIPALPPFAREQGSANARKNDEGRGSSALEKPGQAHEPSGAVLARPHHRFENDDDHTENCERPGKAITDDPMGQLIST